MYSWLERWIFHKRKHSELICVQNTSCSPPNDPANEASLFILLMCTQKKNILRTLSWTHILSLDTPSILYLSYLSSDYWVTLYSLLSYVWHALQLYLKLCIPSHSIDKKTYNREYNTSSTIVFSFQYTSNLTIQEKRTQIHWRLPMQKVYSKLCKWPVLLHRRKYRLYRI